MKKKSIVLFTCKIDFAFISLIFYRTGKPGCGRDSALCQAVSSVISIKKTSFEKASANPSM